MTWRALSAVPSVMGTQGFLHHAETQINLANSAEERRRRDAAAATSTSTSFYNGGDGGGGGGGSGGGRGLHSSTF